MQPDAQKYMKTLTTLIVFNNKIVEKAINKYGNRPSLLLIKNRLKNIPSFSFNEVSLSEIEREINLINPRRATTSNGIPQNL